MLTFSNLTKRYETTLTADNLSFNVQKGEVAVLLGSDGAGPGMNSASVWAWAWEAVKGGGVNKSAHLRAHMLLPVSLVFRIPIPIGQNNIIYC
jgi:ABC-type uncharacterized transport system YnjBCD ATPase subunit